MTLAVPHPLRNVGKQLDTSPEHFGQLRDSNDILNDLPALKARMASDGYLYLPGLMDKQKVLAVRKHVTDRLMRQGFLKPGTDPMDAIVNPDAKNKFNMMDLARDNPPIQELLYPGNLMAFFRRVLGGEVRHFDYTWFRALG